MKKILKQLFCKHNYKEYWSYGTGYLYKFQPYYDAWKVKQCTKCKKQLEL